MPNTNTNINANTNTNTLYDTLKSQRQTEKHVSRLFNRIMLAGYLHEQNCKRVSLDHEKMIKQSIAPFKQKNIITGYLYVKGYFYIHIIQSIEIESLNEYLSTFYKSISAGGKYAESHKQIRIVYQAYESSEQLFKGYDCDNSNQLSGPILIQTDKLEEQILDRSIEIYDFFQDGAKTKRSNPSHRIGNMILLNNDDMSILTSKHFMTLQEYLDIYTNELQVIKQSDLNYPLPPNMFKMIEFMEIGENYKKFVQ